MGDQGDLLVVAIGASAGGIQAMKRFFEHVPDDSGMAFVVILHLSPEHESHLADVLQVSAPIPVAQVRGAVQVEPNHVYVISPLQSLSIEGGMLKVSDALSVEARRAPVDIFFRALAESHGARAACVVLSGTGANGSMGLKRVKEEGGLCLVQDPDEAEFGEMPRNSIATGLVDGVLRVADIPARIMAYRDRLAAVRLSAGPDGGEASDERALRDIFFELRLRTGHDFSSYKRATMLRRIGRRMSLHDSVGLPEYASYLREHPGEAQALLKDLLISVTNFFRDANAFRRLEEVVIPQLFNGKGPEDQVRVWVPGCATGEEAYSIAILLAERVQTLSAAPLVQVFASDIDTSAIAVARQGAYTLNEAADVSPERLEQFFTAQGEIYRVRKEIREMVLFAHHNAIKDPPFSHLDLVSCRNLLIYLNRPAQHRLMHVLHFALNPGGFLFLGSSESVEGSGDQFVTVDADAGLFQSRATTSRSDLPLPEPHVPVRGLDRASGDGPAAGERWARERLSTSDLHQRLLEAYAPPSVVVNENYEIVHLSERAGRYLRYSGGEPTLDLLKAVRPELRLELRAALFQAAHQRSEMHAPGLKLRVEDQPVTVTIVVRPVLRDDDPARGYCLVLFHEVPQGTAPPPEAPTTISATGATRQLEEEVARLKSQLVTATERHEVQAQALRASNEELQAINEELRSSGEELETSKEELQSLNEELRTVNQELQIKVEEQAQAHDNIQNLMNSTEIATIFLDRESRIRLFTPPARALFTVIPGDYGRPLSDISSRLEDADLRGGVAQVLEKLERVEREVRTHDDRWMWMRILPYRTAEDRIAGVVLTFLDITERKRAEDRLRQSENRLRLVIESATDYAIFTLDTDGCIDSWNRGATRLFGYADGEAIGMSAAVLFTPEDRERGMVEEELQQARETGEALDERWHLRKDGSRFFASGAVSSLRAAEGGIVGYVKIARDLTDRKRWEDELQEAHAELERRVQQRTAELQAANAAIDAELSERRRTAEQIRELMRRLITVQEDERTRIARDLHDQLGQQVAGLRLKLSSLEGKAPPNSPLRVALDDALRTLEALDRDLDFYTWELRPAALDDLGLVATLGNFVREWSREFGVRADFQSQGLEGTRFSFETESNLYRITQEALNNVHKHAGARHAGVIFERRNNQVVLVIEDDGLGFERTDTTGASGDRGSGLLGMHERAAIIGGTLEIETSPGKGTTIFVRVPLPDNAAPS